MRLLHGCAAAAMLLTLAACGVGGPDASAGASPTTISNADVLSIGKQVAQCIRDNGVPDFPDPVIDEHGQLQLPDNTEDQLEDVYPQQVLERAQQACQSLFDQLPESAVSGGSSDAEPGPGDVEALRQWAECARQNGFPDWPDPKADGTFPLIGTPLEGEGKSERMHAVAEACKQYWDGGFAIS